MRTFIPIALVISLLLGMAMSGCGGSGKKKKSSDAPLAPKPFAWEDYYHRAGKKSIEELNRIIDDPALGYMEKANAQLTLLTRFIRPYMYADEMVGIFTTTTWLDSLPIRVVNPMEMEDLPGPWAEMNFREGTCVQFALLTGPNTTTNYFVYMVISNEASEPYTDEEVRYFFKGYRPRNKEAYIKEYVIQFIEGRQNTLLHFSRDNILASRIGVNRLLAEKSYAEAEAGERPPSSESSQGN